MVASGGDLLKTQRLKATLNLFSRTDCCEAQTTHRLRTLRRIRRLARPSALLHAGIGKTRLPTLRRITSSCRYVSYPKAARDRLTFPHSGLLSKPCRGKNCHFRDLRAAANTASRLPLRCQPNPVSNYPHRRAKTKSPMGKKTEISRRRSCHTLADAKKRSGANRDLLFTPHMGAAGLSQDGNVS